MKKDNNMSTIINKPKEKTLFSLLKPYRWPVGLLVFLTILSNGLNLAVPKIMSRAIDSFVHGNFVLRTVVIEFVLVAIFIFIFTYLQSIVQTYVSERVARDLRRDLTDKISLQEYAYIQKVTPSKLLTNLTSDIDAVKNFVAQAIASIVSSVFLILGASVLLLLINWKLGLAVLMVVPIIGGTFYFVLKQVRKLFKKAQEAIDWLNKVINESILGAALIRLINSQISEYEKFFAANKEARDIGLNILRLFAILIPVITFATNLATLIILTFGGHLVISGAMSLGDFTAFNSYLAILIFPILIIGFMSNVIAQAGASYQRVSEVLNAKHVEALGLIKKDLHGLVEIKNMTMAYGQHRVLKNISFVARPGTKTAVIGPTAAGKTQLLYALTGLTTPSEGSVGYDEVEIDKYDKQNLHAQVAMVFQDSVIFNLSLRENIAFSNLVNDSDLEKAIATAELTDFVQALPEKLDTVVSERGTSLSGGQKQRIMLARALALNPKVLLLDDFTARVDTDTERKILENIDRNYPGLTLISVTQKIGPIEKYDQIVLLMEGEVLATGTHDTIMTTSPEYVQIYNSQQSTNNYELQT
ncbi:MAG: ABC transporter ATP-binding protein [Candidatus Magasanikbacteria bacterium]|nr:ABC transporter ATP-binding protein [Candidatus Magasanikbacteria bacterium]